MRRGEGGEERRGFTHQKRDDTDHIYQTDPYIDHIAPIDHIDHIDPILRSRSHNCHVRNKT